MYRIGLGGGDTPELISAGGNFINPSGITFAPDGNF